MFFFRGLMMMMMMMMMMRNGRLFLKNGIKWFYVVFEVFDLYFLEPWKRHFQSFRKLF